MAKTATEVDIKDVEVKSGDTIDFVVDCGATASGDEFTWAPTVAWLARTRTGTNPRSSRRRRKSSAARLPRRSCPGSSLRWSYCNPMNSYLSIDGKDSSLSVNMWLELVEHTAPSRVPNVASPVGIGTGFNHQMVKATGRANEGGEGADYCT